MDFEILGCVVVIQRKVVVQQNGFTMSYRFKNRLKGYNKKSHRFRLKCVPSIWIIDIDFEWPSRMGIRFVPWSLEFTRNSQAFVVHWAFEASWVKALGHVVTRCCYKWDPLEFARNSLQFFTDQSNSSALHAAEADHGMVSQWTEVLKTRRIPCTSWGFRVRLITMRIFGYSQIWWVDHELGVCQIFVTKPRLYLMY